MMILDSHRRCFSMGWLSRIFFLLAFPGVCHCLSYLKLRDGMRLFFYTPRPTTTAKSTAPDPDSVVRYEAYPTSSGTLPNNTGKLCVFGNPDSPKMVLMCAGFPDDHTVFSPFAKALSERGNALVGVMCLPGFDDRPEDGIPWQSHPRKGFSIDATVASVREASKALKKVSTHENPEFTGIFHDWGCVPGTLWAHRLEQEARDNNASSSLVPDKIVMFDVLLQPSPSTPDFIPESAVPRLTVYQNLCCIYQLVLAITSWIQTYLSRRLAAAFAVLGFAFMKITTLEPIYEFDLESTEGIYGEKKAGFLRVLSMAYMYRQIFVEVFAGRIGTWYLHEDWKKMPILYLYGKKKKTMYHAFNSLAMLERETAEKRSLSRAVGLEDAGHWLYVQQQETCLKHVLDFIKAEK